MSMEGHGWGNFQCRPGFAINPEGWGEAEACLVFLTVPRRCGVRRGRTCSLKSCRCNPASLLSEDADSMRRLSEVTSMLDHSGRVAETAGPSSWRASGEDRPWRSGGILCRETKVRRGLVPAQRCLWAGPRKAGNGLRGGDRIVGRGECSLPGVASLRGVSWQTRRVRRLR
jgi:hypothetical protein